MKKMEFIRDLSKKTEPVIKENISYEDALLARLDRVVENQVQEFTRGQDKVSMDVPLLLRVMEYAKEDAKTDMDLHHVADKLIELSIDGKVLTMDDYESIVKPASELQDTGSAPEPDVRENIDVGMLRMLAGIKK
jgi:hypothetical protein